jgi:uncharacterized repeat protein (TIGR01451 family)
MRPRILFGLMHCAVATGAAGMLVAAAARAQEPVVATDPLTVSTSAEIERRSDENGHFAVRLLPADHVVSGDLVIYTLEVRNTGPVAVPQPVFTTPIPEHMRYVADSAIAPGAEVSYSIDGGRNFDKADALLVRGPDGAMRRAAPDDYTHIRWVLKNSLKPRSVAYARFRAVLK